MKILACCGSGLASSFIIQKNVDIALKELGIKDAVIEISDLKSAQNVERDVAVAPRDIAAQLSGNVVAINNVMDMIEIRSKLQNTLCDLGYIK